MHNPYNSLYASDMSHFKNILLPKIEIYLYYICYDKIRKLKQKHLFTPISYTFMQLVLDLQKLPFWCTMSVLLQKLLKLVTYIQWYIRLLHGVAYLVTGRVN